MNKSILFLDIDGVCNDHTKKQNGYCGMNDRCVGHLNHILESVPSLRIIVSSSWRYLVLNGSMTIGGFESLMLTHGVKSLRRIVGVTRADPTDAKFGSMAPKQWQEHGLRWRRQQIVEWVHDKSPKRYVILDDLPLEMQWHCQTDANVGLTLRDAEQVIKMLKEQK